MWEKVFNLALNNGLWAALFVALMIYILRDTSKREKKYQTLEDANQKIIYQLSDDLKVVNEIKTITNEISKDIRVLKSKKVNKDKQNVKSKGDIK